MARRLGSLVLSVALLAVVPAAGAAPITYTFSGTFDSGFGPDAFAVPGSFSGHVTYESTTAPSTDDPTSATYRFSPGAGATGALTVGSASYTFDGARIVVSNDQNFGAGPRDLFSLIVLADPFIPGFDHSITGSPPLRSLEFFFEGPASAFASTALPTGDFFPSLNISRFFGTEMMSLDTSGNTGRVTTWAPQQVPEPSTLTLLLAFVGAAGLRLVGARRP